MRQMLHVDFVAVNEIKVFYSILSTCLYNTVLVFKVVGQISNNFYFVFSTCMKHKTLSNYGIPNQSDKFDAIFDVSTDGGR